ncbi:MAG TPA: alpha/beta hydrolase [Glaciibacter sp.]|nr:alpha/beta hydrolase [Glaciibacter sp.]
MNTNAAPSSVHNLHREDGSIAYTSDGDGPLVVCVPGMGDLRSSYRYLAPALRTAGFRVVVTDLRGHGDSDTTFGSYGDEATSGDIAALIEHLGGPAIIVGNSMAAGSAVLVAAERPELVAGLVLVGPFVRDPETNPFTRLLTRVLMAPLWAAASWAAYLPKLYAGAKPDDFDAYKSSVVKAMRATGHAKAFSLTTRTSHRAAEEALPRVHASTLVVMGELDPDFPDAPGEARWIAEQLHGDVCLVPDAAHYPHSQRPDIVSPVIVAFAKSVFARA